MSMRAGVHQGGAAAHQAFGQTPLVIALQSGELHAVVDAGHLFERSGWAVTTRDAVGGGQADDVGQVVLALHVVVATRPSQSARRARSATMMPVLTSVMAALGLAGVLLLDDAQHRAGLSRTMRP
jgi:hypothetical protein